MSNVKDEKTENGFLKKREIHSIDFSISAVVCFLNQVIQPIQEEEIKVIDGFSARIINGTTLKNNLLNFYIEIKPFSWKERNSIIIRLMKLDSDFSWYLCHIGFRCDGKVDEIFMVEYPIYAINLMEGVIKRCRTFFADIIKN